MEEAHGALTQLKAYLAQLDPAANPRVPPERELCEALGVSRGELRKALAILEQEGELWRHVGKGTFLGARPAQELSSVAAIAHRTNPGEVMQARLLIEPQIAGEAALNATAVDIAGMGQCIKGAQEALSWRHYESWDNRLHRAVAEAARNTVLLALFDTLNAVRRAVVWGRLRQQPERPPADHHSFAEHRTIVEAIAERDRPAAAAAMRRHLETVDRKLLQARQAAE
jgi:DNA-binding FadR family transcriptional regulator